MPRILTLFTLLSLFKTSFSQQVPYGNNQKAGRYYNVNGIRLYCEVYGKGAPLLLIHGNGGSISAFKENIADFASHFQVIAVDSRAHGKSVDNSDSLSFEMMADDFAALLDTLKIDSCNVLGWSDGGINALLLALRHPKKVRRLAATGANVFIDSTAFATGLYKEMMNEYEAGKNKARQTAEERNKWKVFVLDVFQPTMKFYDLNAITCPSLIIAGDKDIISLEHTIGIYRNIPNAQLWIVPNSGHATLIAHRKAFDTLVTAFLSQ